MWNFPDQGFNPCPLKCECRILTTEPPRKSFPSSLLSIEFLVDRFSFRPLNISSHYLLASIVSHKKSTVTFLRSLVCDK